MNSTVFVLALLAAVPVSAQSDIGLRGGFAGADGEPANDIPYAGVYGHLALSERWAVGVAVDRVEYDFELPAKLLGLEQDDSEEPVDAKAEGTALSVWIERRSGGWFAGAGLGASSIDVPDVSGPLAGGGAFDIRTDAGTELIASLLAGRRFRLGSRWALDLTVHADQHFADWQVEDRISGLQGSVDDYFTWGGDVGIAFRF